MGQPKLHATGPNVPTAWSPPRRKPVERCSEPLRPVSFYLLWSNGGLAVTFLSNVNFNALESEI